MTTIEETIQQLYVARQRFAIWENVISYLENSFIDQDANRAPQTLILDDGRKVNQEVFREMVTEISDKIMGPLQVEEAKLLDTKVGDPGAEKKPKKPAKKSRKKPKKPVSEPENGSDSDGE